jgi:branched-chain amino acid transport system ATP-binding protein
MLLDIRELVVHYKRVETVRSVSLQVDEGNIVTLIGSNGAGKSTIMRTISGLKVPTSGEIWFQGKRIDGLQPQKIAKMGISQAPEGRGIFPFLSVMANLQLGAYLRKDKKVINDDLEVLFLLFPKLKERIRQKAETLSGGEQQMLAIGRALMAKPKLLLLDEPSLGLSPTMVERIGQIVENINKEAGVTVLLVEQNANMALGLAHKGYVLETGRIALEGEASFLRGNEHVKELYLGG